MYMMRSISTEDFRAMVDARLKEKAEYVESELRRKAETYETIDLLREIQKLEDRLDRLWQNAWQGPLKRS